MIGLIECEDRVKRSVWPSGVARAAIAVPTEPPAPPRFSITIGCPSCLDSGSW